MRKRAAAGLAAALLAVSGCTVSATPSSHSTVAVTSVVAGSVFDASVVHEVSGHDGAGALVGLFPFGDARESVAEDVELP